MNQDQGKNTASQEKNDFYFMQKAILEAKKAYQREEVPVGCVIVLNNQIIARGYNLKETKNNALMHAEIIAINKAVKKLGDWRLNECSMYVTVEPCLMCAGAIIQSRFKRLVFSLNEYKTGAFGSIIDITKLPSNHEIKVTKGVLESQTHSLMTKFFQNLRKK